MLISETYIDRTRDLRIGDVPPYEPCHADDLGALFRSLRSEYGRCIGRVYIDGKEGGSPIAIGWVFVKRVPYDDSPETYLREVWITLHEAPDTVTREHHYKTIGRMR